METRAFLLSSGLDAIAPVFFIKEAVQSCVEGVSLHRSLLYERLFVFQIFLRNPIEAVPQSEIYSMDSDEFLLGVSLHAVPVRVFVYILLLLVILIKPIITSSSSKYV